MLLKLPRFFFVLLRFFFLLLHHAPQICLGRHFRGDIEVLIRFGHSLILRVWKQVEEVGVLHVVVRHDNLIARALRRLLADHSCCLRILFGFVDHVHDVGALGVVSKIAGNPILVDHHKSLSFFYIRLALKWLKRFFLYYWLMPGLINSLLWLWLNLLLHDCVLLRARLLGYLLALRHRLRA